MKLALVSDIHGNLPALHAVCEQIAREHVDQVLNLGDIVSGPLWPAETCDFLMAQGWPTIRGNHERQVLADPARMGASDAYAAARLSEAHRAWLGALPATLRVAGGRVFACHGTPESDLRYLLETVIPGFGGDGWPGVRAARADEVAARLGDVAAELVLCGHTHVPRVAWSAGRLVVNPGSVGLPGFDDDHLHPHIVENGSPHARWALVEDGPAGWQVQLRSTPYDWAAAAAQAEAAGRGDWADALATGRVGRTESGLPR